MSSKWWGQTRHSFPGDISTESVIFLGGNTPDQATIVLSHPLPLPIIEGGVGAPIEKFLRAEF